MSVPPREGPLPAAGPAMRDHVSLLGILYITSGGLGFLLALSFFALALGAAALVPAASPERPGIAVGLTAGAFFVLGLATAGWGGANVWAGGALRRHQRPARTVGLLLAVLHLFLLPFGTVLGIYSFWVLLHDQSRQLFEPAAQFH